jgi:hypothetical protein
MNSKQISKPSLHTTLRVLHNLWLDGHVDLFKMDKILRRDYGCIIHHLYPDFIYVESLDGLNRYSLGNGSKYCAR